MKRIKSLLAVLRKNEKKVEIEHSGSIKGNTKEKIRNGQPYLYKKNGMQSEVIEIRMYENVWGGPLNQALNEAIVRYPYLNTRLVELDGDFYIVKNEASLVATKSERLHPLGDIRINWHLVDVTYWGKSIFVSFHHALCDGKGIKPFVETLIFYYCILFSSVDFGNHPKLTRVDSLFIFSKKKS